MFRLFNHVVTRVISLGPDGLGIRYGVEGILRQSIPLFVLACWEWVSVRTVDWRSSAFSSSRSILKVSLPEMDGKDFPPTTHQ